MRLLLDTHALIWWLQGSKLSKRAKNAIIDPLNLVYVSSVSAWEISTKQRLGKLLEVPKAEQIFDELQEDKHYKMLPITFKHALLAGAFDTAHKDPFDRMLAAQAKIEGLSLVTVDPLIKTFEIETLW